MAAAIPAILHPLKHVPVHVVQTPRVRSERADRSRLTIVPLAPAAVTVARSEPSWLPQLYAVVEPARAAYSHSDSLSKRYEAPVSDDNHRT